MELEGKSYKEVRSDLFSIYKEIGFSDAIKNILNGEAIKVIREDDLVETPQKEEKTFQLRSTWEDIEKHEKAYKVVQDRHIFEAPNLPPRFKLYYDIKFDKIVIPWYRENKLQYYQYRVLGKTDGSKYLFPKDTEKDIFNLDNVDMDFPYIFTLEGAFDSVWVKNGICVGGVSISEHQKEILKMFMMSHEMVYFPDNPYVDKTAKSEIIKLAKNNPNHKVFLWDKGSTYKDINQEINETGEYNKYMDEKFMKKSIITAKKYAVMLKFSIK
jgi:hypothetical protein